MEKLRRLFREPRFHALLVFLFLFVFGWPFLTVPELGSAKASFAGLFAAWSAFIVALYFMSRE